MSNALWFIEDRIKELLGQPLEDNWSRDKFPRFFGSTDAAIAANNYAITNLIGPHQGFVCHVKKIQVGGLTPDTAAPGTANVYVTSMDLRGTIASNQLPTVNWRDRAFQLPLIASYFQDELVALPGEAIFVAFSGSGTNLPTNGLIYVANMQCIMIPATKEYNYGFPSAHRGR